MYIVLVTIFSTLSGLLFGAWVNGTNAWLIVGGTIAGIAAIALVGALINNRSKQHKTVPVKSQ